jgi:hypothetical protein
MKIILTIILSLGYFSLNTWAQHLLHCDFKIMAAQEKTCFFTKKTYITDIKPYPISSIPESKITVNPLGTQKSLVKSTLFNLEFSSTEENIKIKLLPNKYDESYTLANISFEKLMDSEKSRETYFYKLFVPVELKNKKGKMVYIHGLEVGPCELN